MEKIRAASLLCLLGSLALAAPAAAADKATQGWIDGRAKRIGELSAKFKAKQGAYKTMSEVRLYTPNGHVGLFGGVSATFGHAQIRTGGVEYTQTVRGVGPRLTLGWSVGVHEGNMTYKLKPGTTPEKAVPKFELRGVVAAPFVDWAISLPNLKLRGVGEATNLMLGVGLEAGLEARLNFKGKLSPPKMILPLKWAEEGDKIATQALAAHKAGNYAVSERLIGDMEKLVTSIDRDDTRWNNEEE